MNETQSGEDRTVAVLEEKRLGGERSAETSLSMLEGTGTGAAYYYVAMHSRPFTLPHYPCSK